MFRLQQKIRNTSVYVFISVYVFVSVYVCVRGIVMDCVRDTGSWESCFLGVV